MGQTEILNLLRKNKKRWFEVKEISIELGIQQCNIHTQIKKLNYWDYVYVTKIKKKLKVKYKNG